MEIGSHLPPTTTAGCQRCIPAAFCGLWQPDRSAGEL